MRLDTRSDLRAPADLASPAAPADETRKPHAPTGSVWSTEDTNAAAEAPERDLAPAAIRP